MPRAQTEAQRIAINAQNSAYRAANPDRVKAWNERYRARNADRFRQSQREYKRKRYRSDPEYRIVMQLRARLSKAVARGSGASAVIANCGCTAAELIAKIESQFQEGMSWERRSDWHIDHIYPLSAIDPADRRQVLAACNWRNLRPIWAVENFSKSGEVTEEAAILFEQILSAIPGAEGSNAAG